MFPVKYELGFYIPKGAILHSQSHENLKSYILHTSSPSLHPTPFISSDLFAMLLLNLYYSNNNNNNIIIIIIIIIHLSSIYNSLKMNIYRISDI
jgi:hypothetical protein